MMSTFGYEQRAGTVPPDFPRARVLPWLIGLVMMAVTATAGSAEIEVYPHGGASTFDFGSIMSTALPGDVDSESVRYRVEVDAQDNQRWLYDIDFPDSIELHGGHGGDHAEVVFGGPSEGETTPSGRDAFDIVGEVSRIPDIGGVYEGTVPVTVTIVFEE